MWLVLKVSLKYRNVYLSLLGAVKETAVLAGKVKGLGVIELPDHRLPSCALLPLPVVDLV